MATPTYAQPSDGLRRTELFDPDVKPTIAGEYECTTGSGFVMRRRWNGEDWISPINGTVSTVRMMWRGVEPETTQPRAYPAAIAQALLTDIKLRETAKNTMPCPTDTILTPAPAPVVH